MSDVLGCLAGENTAISDGAFPVSLALAMLIAALVGFWLGNIDRVRRQRK